MTDQQRGLYEFAMMSWMSDMTIRWLWIVPVRLAPDLELRSETASAMTARTLSARSDDNLENEADQLSERQSDMTCLAVAWEQS
jgi:hypothetical protein